MLSTPIRNVVLVHGAFADASGSKPVYDRLVAKGYHVSAAARETKPSYAMVADADHTINPKPERWIYARAKAKVIEQGAGR